MLVSAIIPVHNGEPFLGAAIESVLAQGHDEIEIIVVNDGSSDESAAVARAYADRPDSVVRYHRQPMPARQWPATRASHWRVGLSLLSWMPTICGSMESSLPNLLRCRLTQHWRPSSER
ncbi:MAG: glycosyltransferase family 2 protein [Caldilineaceae bacterium]|nr:glycosyltransferase family 2 protein [Caldilineaceae bacterium]